MTRRRATVAGCLAGLLLTALLCGILFGPTSLGVREVWRALLPGRSGGTVPAHVVSIVHRIRLPRAVLGALVGAALSLSGAALQGLFRNPLASPYVLGVAGGAAAGAALAILLAGPHTWLLPVGAFVGAIIAVTLVYGLARGRDRRTSTFTLILAGVAVSALFGAVTSFAIFVSSRGERMADIVFWMLGGLGRADWTDILILCPVVLAGLLVLVALAPRLNALARGEQGAFHLGVHPERTTRWILLLTTLLTATAVSMAGTIGFVGLIIPHLLRLLIGSDHRVLLPASAIGGAAFLVWADLAARTLLRPVELPVGILTAFLGAPFFLFLLRTQARRPS